MEKRIQARGELREIRTRLNEMNTTQQAQFFNGFTPKELARLQKGLVRAVASKTGREIAKVEAELAKVKAQLAALQG